jgi:uncharacterized iron-regulated membrane protein
LFAAGLVERVRRRVGAVFVFITGTPSVFKDEITRWMQPELPLRSQPAQYPPAAKMAETALDYLVHWPEAAQAQAWSIDLPHDGQW